MTLSKRHSCRFLVLTTRGGDVRWGIRHAPPGLASNAWNILGQFVIWITQRLRMGSKTYLAHLLYWQQRGETEK